jgi:hypothetical protein
MRAAMKVIIDHSAPHRVTVYIDIAGYLGTMRDVMLSMSEASRVSTALEERFLGFASE